MESREINPGLLMRLLTLFLYNLNKIPCVYRLRKHPGRILLVSSKLCIKATAFTTLTEANTMQFVANKTSIPVPKVHCSFEYKGRVYILMERIRGQDLSQDWTQRSEDSKARILAQMKTFITELRSIPPPEGVGVANVDGGPVFDQRLPDKSFWGPFATIQEFHRELRRGLELQDGEEAFPGLRELVEFHNGPWEGPVFTHGDLSSLNIMAVGNTVTGILDWESAGWMPPYWEYTSAWHVNPRNTFWRDAVDGFLTPLPHELEMEKIRRQYFGEF
ncbi:kinase-like domain-containing protein [Fusarium mundagurra]|uniref:Kinase-like domain-containing protein n=1 Tax=Fusarium mundagurra TaxID=1567541 RepID=A0A8H5YG27_9HYPO|nr:kinase-like domain-containing protein [Fusarium mundagurra]